MDHISIVIVHYNTDKETRECLESLKRLKSSSTFKFNVVLLDNASKKPYKLKIKDDKFELIRSDSNLGFTGGNNLAIKYSLEKYNSDYVLLLNNDTTVDPDFLKNLYKCAKDESQVGLVVPKIYFEKGYEFHRSSYNATQKGSVIWFAGGSIDWQNIASYHRGVDEVDRGQFAKTTDIDFATGCCVLIPREIIETVGLLNDDLFLYSEDVDYSIRVKRAGYKLLFCPDSAIWHKNAGSSGGSGSPTQQYYQTRNTLWVAFNYGDYRSKYVALRIILSIFLKGDKIQKLAVQDFVTGNMGKKPVIE